MRKVVQIQHMLNWQLSLAQLLFDIPFKVNVIWSQYTSSQYHNNTTSKWTIKR